MNNKPPTTNTLCYYDSVSNEWVTVITIRHAAENLPKVDPTSFSLFKKDETYSSKSKLEQALSQENLFSQSKITLPKVSIENSWNK